MNDVYCDTNTLRKADGFIQDVWPFKFTLISDYDLLLDAASIVTFAVNVYNGRVKPESDISAFPRLATLASLVDSQAVATDGYKLKLQHPGDNWKGKKLTLIFKTVFSNGAKFPMYFYPLVIK